MKLGLCTMLEWTPPKWRYVTTEAGTEGFLPPRQFFPGERLLLLPHTAMISEHMLQHGGKRILNCRSDIFDLDDAFGAEEWAIGMIEELRQADASLRTQHRFPTVLAGELHDMRK